MSLLKLKSIFSPNADSAEFQNNQTDLSNFDSIYDDGLTTPTQTNLINSPRQFDNNFQQTNLLNYEPIGGSSDFTSETNINEKTQLFKSNQPFDKFDTRLDYDTFPFASQTFTFDADLTKRSGREDPILDSVLRGRVYEPIRFSQNFENNNLFVKPEKGEVENSLFRSQTFDPRAVTPKQNTLYFNTNNTMGTLQYGEGGFMANVPTLLQRVTDFSTATGNNELPFTSLNQLGISFYNGDFNENNLSWESLYNSNHTPKENPEWSGAGLSPINYGVNVNRDKLKIGDNNRLYGAKSGIIGAFDRGQEPYIVSLIGNEGRGINKGGQFNPSDRAATDGDRILSFLESEEGKQFIIRQNINVPISNTVVMNKDGTGLIRKPQRFNSFYNPLSTIVSTEGRALGAGIPNVLTKRGGAPILDAINIFSPTEYGKDATTSGFSINDTFTRHDASSTGGDSFFDKIEKTIKSTFSDTLGNLNPFGEGGTEVTPYSSGDKVTLSSMIRGNRLDVFGIDPEVAKYDRYAIKNLTTGKRVAESTERAINKKKMDIFQKTNKMFDPFNKTTGNLPEQLDINIESEEHGMPFYFKDMRTKQYIFFRAYLEGITETVTPTWTPHNYIGRSEPVYTYERGEREVSFNLKLVAQTKAELDKIYDKMEALTGLCYPEYVNDGYGNRMKPPLTKFRMGELYGNTNKEVLGFVKSLNYVVEQTSPFETKRGKRVPRHITATIVYQIIHDKAPRVGFDGNNKKLVNFYGVNQ